MTEGTSLSARQTLTALGALASPDRQHVIDVMDPNPLCQGRFSRFPRRWIRCPHYAKEPEKFLAFLAEKVLSGRYDVLLPTHEQVYLLSRFHHLLRPHIGIALPDFHSMDRMQNKALFMRLLKDLGIPHPESVPVRTRDELEREARYPCYVKLGHSTAGSGVFLVENSDELADVADRMESDGLLDGHCETVLQQPAKGVQSTVQAVFQHGRLVDAHLFEARRLGVGGMSPARVSANHPVVFEHVAAMGEALRWHGATFIDYFYDHDRQRPEYIEANPRIGETVNATLCGTNLAERLIDVSLDVDCPTMSPQDCATKAEASAGRRTQSFYMIAISDAYEGATRGQLWRALRNWRGGRELYQNSADELSRLGEDPWSSLPVVWIMAQLLASPWGGSHRLVRQTIENYSLPESAVERMLRVPMSALSDHLPARADRV